MVRVVRSWSKRMFVDDSEGDYVFQRGIGESVMET